MLKCLEMFWNTIGFPKESTISRSFIEQQVINESIVKVSHLEDGEKDKIKVELSETDMDKKNGKQDTLRVYAQEVILFLIFSGKTVFLPRLISSQRMKENCP